MFEKLRLFLTERELARIVAEPMPHQSARELYRDASTMKRAAISPEEQEIVLRARFSNYARPIQDREFDNAIRNAADSDTPTGPRYPQPSPEAIKNVKATSAGALDRLRAKSPTKNPGNLSSGAVIDRLFKPTDLLCFGTAGHRATTEPRTHFVGREDAYPLIVPNPMSQKMGETKEGKPSPRTLSNVGPRANAVIEFDSGTLDEQAEIILHLKRVGPVLRLVVFSGSKSLHSWFDVRFVEPSETEKFLRYAAFLGADTATFNPVQFVRTPNAWRDDERQQSVQFLA